LGEGIERAVIGVQQAHFGRCGALTQCKTRGDLRGDFVWCTFHGLGATRKVTNKTMHADRRRRTKSKRSAEDTVETAAAPRIIGGTLRGRKLKYAVESRTRAMKERVREALFNLLGPAVREKHAIDLFAGTGALAFEAISRGASDATLVEHHFPTAKSIRENAAALGIAERCQVLPANVLLWAKRLPVLPERPWVVFCSPPWDLLVERTDAILALVGRLMEAAPAESMFAVEADRRFDFRQLPSAEEWDVRGYPPAVVGVWTKEQ
jgi:16S rRNA (guanine966-N2)-methyltransferase